MGASSSSSSSGTTSELQQFLSTLASNLQQQGPGAASGLFVSTTA
ncbi:hypothetical protein AB4Y45_00675 [Paraburkholderia sp. EG287A]